MWSPHWSFTDDQYAATVGSFENPDFVEVVVHSYRHRYGLAAGDPAYELTEKRIAGQPKITVPTVILDATQDGLGPPPAASEHADHFTQVVAHRLVDAGHDLPQETLTSSPRPCWHYAHARNSNHPSSFSYRSAFVHQRLGYGNRVNAVQWRGRTMVKSRRSSVATWLICSRSARAMIDRSVGSRWASR